jgi:phage-related minor tail protein
VAGKIKGITITLGADVQPLNKALEDVNKKSRDLQGELRQVERLLKLDPSNTTLLAQKQKLLADAVENSREKLDRLKTAQEQVNEQFRKGEINEEQYRAFQREVVKAEQELSKFEKQLRETGLTAEQVGKKLQDAGQKMTDMGKTLSMSVTAPIVAAGAASFKMAADLQDAMGATEQIFKGAADSVKSWADNLESYYGIAEGEALEYANMMGTMLINIGGLTEEQAAKQAQTLIELAGDLAAMYGGAPADAVRALTGALKGNNTMLDNYGMAVNDAMIKTKAFEMGIYSGKGEMDLATKQAATLALIMEQTGAAQGQAAREADGASGSMRALVTEIKNLSTDIGEVLLPVITPFIQKLKDIVGTFSELSPGVQKAIIAIAGIAAAIGPLLLILGPVVSAIGTLVTGLGAMSTAMAGGASIVAGLTAGFPALGAAITLITGPIGIAIAAIAGLVAIGVALYKNWDKIKAKAAEIWGVIRDTLVGILDAIKGFIEERWNAVATTTTTVWTTISDWLSALWERIKAQVTASWNVIYGTITDIWTRIKAGFDNLVKSAWNWGKNLLAEFIAGIKSKISALWDTLTNIAETVAGFLGFHSPTKLGPGRYADQWAPNFMRMFADGITKNLPLLEKALSRAVVVMQMSLAGGGSIPNVTYNTSDNRVINITVQDGEDLLRTLHRLGVRIP